MPISSFLSILLVAGLVGNPPLAPAPDSLLLREQLAPDIWLFRAPSSLDKWTSTNVVVVLGDQDVTVFDSNARPGTARLVIAEIARLTDKPVRTLINSHWHLDHWSGNGEYVKAFPGIQIVSTQGTREYMSARTSFDCCARRLFSGRRPSACARVIRSGARTDANLSP